MIVNGVYKWTEWHVFFMIINKNWDQLKNEGHFGKAVLHVSKSFEEQSITQ